MRTRLDMNFLQKFRLSGFFPNHICAFFKRINRCCELPMSDRFVKKWLHTLEKFVLNVEINNDYIKMTYLKRKFQECVKRFSNTIQCSVFFRLSFDLSRAKIQREIVSVSNRHEKKFKELSARKKGPYHFPKSYWCQCCAKYTSYSAT